MTAWKPGASCEETAGTADTGKRKMEQGNGEKYKK